MKVHRNRKKSYTILAISVALFLILTIILLIANRSSLKFSVKDGDTLTLEYGIDSVPAVTALYWESIFDKEGTEVPVTTHGDIDENTLGTYTLTHSAAFEGKSISITQTIIIQDTTAPVITLEGNDIGYYSPGYTYKETGYTAIDNHDGDITSQVVCTKDGDRITYSVTDSMGNSSSVTRNLECKDVVAPVISLNGEDRILLEFGDSYTDAGATAIDDVDGDLTNSLNVSGSIDSTLYGEQYITYHVTDSNGNTATKERIIVIKEGIAPELTLKGNEYEFVKLNEQYIEPGFIASDNADGDITPLVKVDGTVDVTKVGTYPITYTCTDSSNNVTTVERTVYVYTGEYDTEVKPNGKVVYLSFDDGPGPYTEQLLDILDKYNVKVTFFVTAQFSDYLDMIGEAHRRGHTIAMHTYTHNFAQIYSSSSAYYDDLNKIKEVCEKQTGVSPTILRFPGGTSNTTSKNFCPGIMTSLTQSLPANGYQYCDWNVDSMDAGGAATSAEVSNNVISGLQKYRSAFVLQHDTKKFSVEAVEDILIWGLKNGYVFMPLDKNTSMNHHPVFN